jgi:NADPH-dependent curcumin reductase CurA
MVQRSDFDYAEAPVGQPADGEVLVKILYISLDPAMRGWMNEGKSYVPPVGIGEVMRAGAVGRVIASRDPNIAVGDHVVGILGVQEYAVAKGKQLTKVDPGKAPLPVYLGTLGMPGMTAYFGLLEVGRPKEGDTVVVSGAAGAVGQVVGQVAKIKGCRAVGIAGGKEKCDYAVRELGFDACVDYKAANLYEALKAACPSGIDCYFENVGGEVMDTVFRLFNPFARVALCGLISDYNTTEPYGVKMIRSLLVNRVNLRGFIVYDRMDLYQRAIGQLAKAVSEGRIKYHETVAHGLENAPKAFIGMLKGQNLGKQLVKVA